MNPTLTYNPRAFSAKELIALGVMASTFIALALLPTLPRVELYDAGVQSVQSLTHTLSFSGASASNPAPIANAFFGEIANTPAAEQKIQDEMDYVASRGAYPASLAVIEQYAGEITLEANKQGVPADVAIGVAFLENGGSVTAKSPAGALGVYQLMPYTARNLGLTVTKSHDERLDPTKSIAAGITYLKMNFDRFGDWGLATWAYHAGEGNVAKAVKIYAKANDSVALKGISDFGQMRNYIETHGITVHKLLSDASVQKFTDTLHDDSSGYPYKVVATATLFRQANSLAVR